MKNLCCSIVTIRYGNDINWQFRVNNNNSYTLNFLINETTISVKRDTAPRELFAVKHEEQTLQVTLKIRNLVLCGTVLILMGLIGATTPVLASVTSNHAAEDSNCSKCHFDWKAGGNGASAWGVDEHKGFTNKKNHQEMLCDECHSAVTDASHPTGFVPTRTLPTEFPLNARGKMTCTTCHDIQKNGKPSLQAKESGKEFCLSCHSESFFAEMVDAGNSLITSGHISAENESRGTVDNYSLQCMTCHADQAAISGGKLASRTFMLATSGGGSHPIGTNYQVMSSYDGYRVASSLPEEIVLPNGQVGCITCHKPYTKNHGEPVLKENLCTTCHDK